jgi:thioredoxin reductase (NADPH)
MPISKYIIKRADLTVEDLVLESEGLTIGRLPGNELTLNHRAISDAHLGVKAIDGVHWIFNLSNSNRVILDGAVIDQAPIEGGATIQIGPFLLRMAVCPDALLIVVEFEGGFVAGGEAARVTSQLCDASPPRVTRALSSPDEEALKIFWNKRRRESGKMIERTLLHLQHGHQVGKAQFNWTPTQDLKQSWRSSWFLWAGLLTAAFSLLAILTGWEKSFALRPIGIALNWKTLQLKLAETPWYIWLNLAAIPPISGLLLWSAQGFRRRTFLRKITTAGADVQTGSLASESPVPSTPISDRPAFPHPVINPALCIGCHACVEACPHNVIEIVNGTATPAAIDQCMEDLSCMVECPTVPKACVVVNTQKAIPLRKSPRRDRRLMTNIPGVYLIGDVSGLPLIKNAVNEGARVIETILEDLRLEESAPDFAPDSAYDVAIIGAGPAGVSAAAIAKQRGLRAIVIEQNRILNAIQNFPEGKYVAFKPDHMDAKGVLPLTGTGAQKEALLATWMRIIAAQGIEIHEGVSCHDIQPIDRGFSVYTTGGRAKKPTAYFVRRVILAIGNHSSPMKLGVPGEDRKVPGPPPTPWRFENKVKYRLSTPEEYRGKKCLVVGAGNSAVEAAVALTGFRRNSDRIEFTGHNEVTLVVRGDFKGDLKLINKMNVYDCLDANRIKIYFGASIKEIKAKEVLLVDAGTGAERATIPNDYVFALIGSEKPIRFLESIGVEIGLQDASAISQ